jgi:uncharacterized sporulation protein YeaH/YhbH (DUF444 family)
MTRIVDRRLNGKNKSAVNRQRFIRRFKSQIKEAVNHAINKRSITDLESGEQISIPAKDTKEHFFQHGLGGSKEYVHVGNKEFQKHDHVARPNQVPRGKGSKASDQGQGFDDFVFQISKDEFLDIFFEELALPDLVKKQLAKIPTYKSVRAGYSITGVPCNINIIRSLKGALMRKMIIGSPYKRQLLSAEQTLLMLNANTTEDNQTLINETEATIEELKNKIKAIPFIDTFDIKYNNRIRQLTPTTQAVMFCIMDVSGSMDKVKKDIAKRFFILLYLFLKRNYEKINVVFIRHHTSAKEVNEEDFFYSRETGGTVVSSALQLMHKIIRERYDINSWNIYAAQASDGDNWNADSPYCSEILSNSIMPYVQYYAYVEILPRLHQSLWESYISVKDQYKNFSMQTINEVTEIYPVFHKLFSRAAK